MPGNAPILWRQYQIQGIVQGVGFRPAVWRHAVAHDLIGGVQNTLGGVRIIVGGTAEALAAFEQTLPQALPGPAKIDSLESAPAAALDTHEFLIFPSEPRDKAGVVIPPDLATCDACLAEMFAPENRRYRYAFTACAQCGPRYTMVEALPYDRERTTMRDFPLCPQCRAEYDSPADRRYHAECTACEECGPQLELQVGPPCRGGLELPRKNTDTRTNTDRHGLTRTDTDTEVESSPAGRTYLGGEAFAGAVALLREEAVGAIKGLGGYHLCCDALRESPIARLRQRKRRPHKPFAVMAASLEIARQFARISPAEARYLESPERPIVLLEKIPGAAPESLAPGNARLGIMLPYTPLHHLLLREFDLLVMTSANESEEPIFHREEEVAPWLGTVVDFILGHNRRIWNKCDDSVLLVQGERPALVRRARGFVPLPVRLEKQGTGTAARTLNVADPFSSRRASPRFSSLIHEYPPLLACGGDLKNVFALARGGQIYLSAHNGDLENAAALDNYREQIERMEALLQLTPRLIVHDLHPGYHSTQYALESPIENKLAVQHHHAHLAACLADNDFDGRAIGLIFDGTGYGADGTIWGGEFLVGDAGGYQRMGCFKPIAMPGGEKAIREPWRMALSALREAVGVEEAQRVVAGYLGETKAADVALLLRALDGRIAFPLTSSAGRQFDIMGFLLAFPIDDSHFRRMGSCPMRTNFNTTNAAWGRTPSYENAASSNAIGNMEQEPIGRNSVDGGGISFEAQLAMWLEALALHAQPQAAMPEFGILEKDGLLQIDTALFYRATLEQLQRGAAIESLAAAFHEKFVEAAVRVAIQLRDTTGLNTVACSGGVFLNAILATRIEQRLCEEKFDVLFHRLTPPGDGCIALGQAAVAVKFKIKNLKLIIQN